MHCEAYISIKFNQLGNTYILGTLLFTSQKLGGIGVEMAVWY